MKKAKALLLWGSLGILMLAALLWRFPTLSLLLFGGIALAYFLFPIVSHFQKKQMPLTAAILLTYSVLGIILAFLLFVITPLFYKEMLDFMDHSQEYLVFFEELWADLYSKLSGIFPFELFAEKAQILTAFIDEKTAAYADSILEKLTVLPTRLSSLLLSPVVAYYLLKDYSTIGTGFLNFFPPRYRSEITLLATEIHSLLWGFIKGNLLVSLFVGTMTGLGLWALGVDYPLGLGILAGLMDMIPYFGPLLSGIPIFLFAILQNHVNLFLLLLLLVFVQQFENIVISPRIIGNSVGLPPLAIILLVFLGGSVGGLLGMVLVIPIAAIIKVIGAFLYRRFVAYHFREE